MRAVIRGSGRRAGTSTAIAAVALIALLAAGFGALGGRPHPSAAVTIADASPTSSRAPATPARTPLATPDGACGPLPPEGPPGVMLSVGDHLMAGAVDYDEGPTPGAHREPIDIPADAITQLRIAAGACATGWHVAVWSPSDGQLRPVAVLDNEEEDPAIAQVNGLDLVLTPFRALPPGGLELRAALQLPGRDVLARWPVRLLPFPRPHPALQLPNDAVLQLVEGCDTVLTFNNGFEERLPECQGDLSSRPAPAVQLPPGSEMTLEFDGWSIGDTIGYCGATSDLAFLLPSPPGCEQHPPHGQSFVAPRAGDWTMAIAACAIKDGNRICGTWYANVDTR